MNTDCVFLILELLDLDDLVKVAQVNDQLSILTADVFRHKYSRRQIVVFENFPLRDNAMNLQNKSETKITAETIPQEISSKDELAESEMKLKLANYDLILNTFKHFGHLIKRFESSIFTKHRDLQAEFIGRLISEYSAESLIEIDIGHSAEVVLEYIKKPLVNVENLAFRGNDLVFHPRGIRFEQLFPNLHRLNLFSSTYYSLLYFDYHMPRLEHISIIRSHQWYRNPPFPKFIEKNSQIRSLELQGGDFEFLQNVKTFLPQLETLTLQQFELQNGSIHFESVTTIFLKFFASPINLHFPRLRTIHIDYNGVYSAEYRTFLNEHNHLRHLHLAYWTLHDSQFQQLTENLTELVEMTLEQKPESEVLSPAAIVNFLRRQPKMKRFNVINLPTHQNAELQKQLGCQWNARINGTGLTFIRS